MRDWQLFPFWCWVEEFHWSIVTLRITQRVALSLLQLCLPKDYEWCCSISNTIRSNCGFLSLIYCTVQYNNMVLAKKCTEIIRRCRHCFFCFNVTLFCWGFSFVKFSCEYFSFRFSASHGLRSRAQHPLTNSHTNRSIYLWRGQKSFDCQ